MVSNTENLPMGMKPINIRAARLSYKESGIGQPLILVHANLSDVRSWDAVFPLLAKTFRVFAYSRRYHWPNEGIPDDTIDDWEDQAEDLAALIDTLNVSPAILMGNSSGATIALVVAKKYPSKVHALILEEPPVMSLFLPRTPPAILDILGLLLWHPLYFWPLVYFGATVIDPTEKHFRREEVEAALNVFVKGVVGDELFKLLSKDRWEQITVNAKPHQALFRLGPKLPSFTEEDAKAISVPALMIGGDKSVPAHKCINAQLTSLMPRGQQTIIQGASHFMHEDDAAQVSAEIIKWHNF